MKSPTKVVTVSNDPRRSCNNRNKWNSTIHNVVSHNYSNMPQIIQPFGQAINYSPNPTPHLS